MRMVSVVRSSGDMRAMLIGLGRAVRLMLWLIFTGEETDGRTFVPPKGCISGLATSSTHGGQNSSTVQESSLSEKTQANKISDRPYETLFFIAVATVAVLLPVSMLLIYKLVKFKEEYLSLKSKLQRLGTLTAQGHASDAGEEPHYCPLQGKGDNSEIYTHLPGQT